MGLDAAYPSVNQAALEDELLSSEPEDEAAARFFRFFKPFFSSLPAPAAPRVSGSSSLGSMKRGRALGLSSCCVRVGRAV